MEKISGDDGHTPGRRAGMAVGAEHDDGADLPRRTPGGFENRDVERWSAPAAARYAGVDQSRRYIRPRAGPSGSRTRALAGTQIARTYDCLARASPVCIQWGRG